MIDVLKAEIEACEICKDRFAKTATTHAPRPVFWGSDAAPILIAGQAPGARVHRSGRPFDDPSGDRLRLWLGVDRKVFYDRMKFAIVPMAFCFPGYNARGADLPPPAICGQTWHDRVFAAMPQIQTRIYVGGYALRWHMNKHNVTEAVAGWREHAPLVFPLPHPSWRNTGWLKKHPWFEAEVIPALRARVLEVVS
ncbi:MAG: uracil-DNA glycosylase family protein [Pseudomonadota bacterium]